jgi:3-phenylpropionate/cinnamic acid dioxygenase small subunit
MTALNASSYALSAQDDRAIAALLIAYGCAIDRRDWEKFRACFSDDCACDYGSFGKWQGASAVTHYMKQAHADLGPTLHRITNIETRMQDGQAHARSYVDALLMPVTVGGPVHHGIGHYDDQLVRTGAGWRIARRQFVAVFLD